jgi:hypothetical protein
MIPLNVHCLEQLNSRDRQENAGGQEWRRVSNGKSLFNRHRVLAKKMKMFWRWMVNMYNIVLHITVHCYK